jgi:hypothetical protein
MPEDNTQPAATTKTFGKAPVSVRAKEDYIDFLNSLLPQCGNSQSAVIEHCIRAAKANTSPVNQEALQELDKLRKKVQEHERNKDTNRDNEIATLQKQIAELKKLPPVPSLSGGITIPEDVKTFLDTIISKRKLKDIQEGIRHCIRYTFKNDWI